MAEYTLTNTAAVVDASIQKVAGANTTPTDGSPLMVTSGGVKAYVDTEIANNPATAALITEVAELSEDFYKETFFKSGTVSSTTTLITFTAPVDGLYAGLLVGTYYFTLSSFQNLWLYWENQGEVFGDFSNGWVKANPVDSNGTPVNTRFAFTRTPVALLQGQTIKLRTIENGTRTATYNLTFKISRLV